MSWWGTLAATQPVAHAVLVLSAIAVAGLALASVRIRGVGFGVAGVLFAGILAGQIGWRIDPRILEFVREFGLILFVFTIGLQLAPSFFASFRREGLRLNLLAVAVVLLGLGVTLLGAWLAGLPGTVAIGLCSGATTNTPSLGAAQQALQSIGGPATDAIALAALAYAVAYPGGVFGIIAALTLLRVCYRIDPEAEAATFRREQQRGIEPLVRRNFLVDNPRLDGLRIADIPGREKLRVIVSRIKREGETEAQTATLDTRLGMGDVILAVGTAPHLGQFHDVVGRASELDLTKAPGLVTNRRVVVTRQGVLGKTIRELGLDLLYGVTVTRVTRTDLEMTAIPELRLQFGDMLQVVGEAESLDQVAGVVGNSKRALNETNFIPIFIGIALGVLAGSLPVCFPGVPAPLRLGLAGGPLILAILLGRLGRIGPLVWYMPVNANIAFRELGITLFLACVGLRAGEGFLTTVFTPTGLAWLAVGAAVTLVPLLMVGFVARGLLRLNYTSISGLLAGSMTDPPALAFATGLARSDAPSVAYATVYPLTMLLRILVAQLLVLALAR